MVLIPVLFLMVLSPLLAEVLGGAMPLTDFVSPGIFFPFVFFLYGLPILVIREVATRAELGPLGLWLLGMVYGLYNEGLFSETLYHPLEHPLESYASYGLVEGLRLPWLFYILPWHGVLSVLLPVLLVDRLFPKYAGRLWLPRKATWCLGVVTAGLAIARFVFWGEDRGVQDAGTFAIHLAFVLVVAAALCLLAVRLSRTPCFDSVVEGRQRLWRPFAAGAGLYALVVLGADLLAEAAVPWPVTVAFSAVGILGTVWAVTRRRATTRTTAVAFVLGCGMAQVALALVVGPLIGNLLWALVAAVFAVAFAIVLARLPRNRAVRGRHG